MQTFRISVPSPKYVQIAETLLGRIESGELAPGAQLPSERELSETLGVTRVTIRKALDVLCSRGLLHKHQGQGTFVSSPKIERHAEKLVPFTSGMQRRGFKAENRLVSLQKIPAEVSLASELGLAVGDSVYFIHRVRLINHEPVMLERLYVPATFFPELERFDFSRRSLYEVMETEYNVTVRRARQSFEPVNASEYEAELLGVRPDFALMLERRLVFDQADRPVERARDLYRGDRFRFVTEMAPLEL